MLAICFKLQNLATMSPSGWYPPHVDNTDTMYLGDQHDLVITSVNFCFWLVFSSVSICQLLISNKWQSYMSGKLDLGLKLNINCCFKLFRNPHKNWGRISELTFSAIIINTGETSFQYQITLGAQPGIGTQKNWIFTPEKNLTSLNKFVSLHTEKYF